MPLPVISGRMAGSVAIVTDTTSNLPRDLAAKYDIAVVPVQVVLNSQVYTEGVDISAEEVAAALRASQTLTTSRPTPDAFANAFQSAADAGAEEIVSIHLSSTLSGTYQSAMLAAQTSPIPVRVVDSRAVSMALGFAALAAARVAARGGDVDAVVEAANSTSAQTDLFFYVDTLEHLKKGGRIGSRSALIGTALQVKPILKLVDGNVVAFEKTRTAGKALARLAELALTSASGREVDFAVQHLDSQDRADDLAFQLSSAVPDADIIRCDIGAVIGTHVGPGMVAVVIAPRADE